MNAATNHPPPANWQALADALRAELQEFGGLLALIDQQRDQLLARNSNAVLDRSRAIENQVALLQQCREHRDSLLRAWFRACGHTEEASLDTIAMTLPPSAQPLFEAFLNEGYRLSGRLQRHAQRNAALLQRAHSATDSLLSLLHPPDGPSGRTYASNGHPSAKQRSGSIVRKAV